MNRWRISAIALLILALLGVTHAHAQSFNSPVLYPAGTFPADIKVADFNEDGHVDAVTADMFGYTWGGGTISVYINSGTGTFTRTQLGPWGLLYVPSGTPRITSLDVGDVNGDGHVDIVFTSLTGEFIGRLFGNGDGTFRPMQPINVAPGAQAYPAHLALGHVDGDSDLDIVLVRDIGNGVQAWLGNGDGTFIAGPLVAVGGGPDGVALGDFDNDGHLDAVVIENQGATAAVLFGNGLGGFSLSARYTVVGVTGNNPTPHLNPVVTGDIDDDGDLDIVVSGNHSLGIVNLLKNNGAGRFTTSGLSITPRTPWGTVITDIDGDGITDMGFADRGGSGSVVMVRGLGAGAFAAPVRVPAPGALMGLAAADFNGDGLVDFATTAPFSGRVAFIMRRVQDSTAPVITPQIAGTLGTGGWYVSDVNVSWLVSDPESQISAKSGCTTTTITTDTDGVTLTCTATSAGGTASKSVTIKRDTTGPVITGLPSNCSLWPANHAMVHVATVAAGDGLSDLLTLNVTATSSESDNGVGDGNTGADIVIDGGDVYLRAERSGRGTGRTYAVTATASDVAGNVTTATASCVVPHDKRK